MTDATKLSPCPFCGNDEALIARTHTEVADPKRGWPTAIHCTKCGADGPTIWTRIYQPPEVEAAWNQRGKRGVRQLFGFLTFDQDSSLPDDMVVVRDKQGRTVATMLLDAATETWKVLR